MENIKLTEYSKGAGCGCKIAPQQLQEILQTNTIAFADPNLLVGNATNDDAAVLDLDGTNCLISTTDFFTPIVNDAFAFGQVAAANAISDVYAMGGKPLIAIAILGWPIEKLPTALAAQVLDGARSICTKAGIALAGGHSIDSVEPIFGLSVNGIVVKQNIKQNNTAQVGDTIFLTKPIGIGLLTTAEKKNVLLPEHENLAVHYMTMLNSIGTILATNANVTAMTDVTGFGIAGHLIEMCEGAAVSAELYWNKIPKITNIEHYIKTGIRPDATTRNWNSYGKKLAIEKSVPMMEAFTLLPDPQTSGGLLFTVSEAGVAFVTAALAEAGLQDCITPIGRIIAKEEKVVLVS